MGKYLIYSIEDDSEIAHIINLALTKSDYEVKTFEDGESFLKAFTEKKPNLILLDLMLPGIQGREILKIIREDSSNENIIVIIVSAKSLISDKTEQLDLGADDYIEKPFDLKELLSRVNVHYRKYRNNENFIKINDYSINFDEKVFKKEGVKIKLTPMEFKILKILFKNRGSVVTRSELFNYIWGSSEAYESRTIDMHIKSLREKIGDKRKKFIISIYGKGYKIN